MFIIAGGSGGGSGGGGSGGGEQDTVPEGVTLTTNNPALSTYKYYIYSDGTDAGSFTATFLNAAGQPIVGATVSISHTRPTLRAPDGSSLGASMSFRLNNQTTDSQGRVSGTFTSNISTRVDAMLEDLRTGAIDDFTFSLSAGGKTFSGIGPIIVESRVDSNRSTVSIVAATNPANGYCAGEAVNIVINAQNRNGGTASNRFVAISNSVLSNLQFISGASPVGGWLTNSSGQITFRYTPKPDDKGKIVRAWVDGQTLDDLKSFNFAARCNSS
jgi:hypothetical protein